MRDHTQRYYNNIGVYAIVILSFLLLAIGVLCADIEGNAYFIARSGAAIVAVTTLVALMQFRWDESTRKGERAIAILSAETYQSYMDRGDTERAETAAQEIQLYYANLAAAQRGRLINILVFGTALGTIVHGFGDIIGNVFGIPLGH